MRSLKTSLIAIAMTASLGVSSQAVADHLRTYDVTITNLTRGQTFTPIMVATHRTGVQLFTPGEPASPELALLAEDGATAPIRGLLEESPETTTTDSGGLLGPGRSVTVTITANRWARAVSIAAMLIPTNDGFLAFRNVPLPRRRHVVTLRGPAYDAGSEPNDEVCANIPGPVCGGTGASPDAGGELGTDGEPLGVTIHAGIHGIADLVAADRDWRNPVAQVSIRRTR